MTDLPTEGERITPVPDIGGRIVGAGRGANGNEVQIDIGRGQCIRIVGASDTVTKAFALNLFKYVLIEFGVSKDG